VPLIRGLRSVSSSGAVPLSIITGYDPKTLRETIDAQAAEARFAELGTLRSLSALNEKVELLRLLGRNDEAWDVANEALRQARFSGDRETALAARIRRAQVQQYQGKLQPALTDLTICVEEARGHEWGALEAAALHNRGKVLFDQHEYADALVDFKAAVFLWEKSGASLDQLESSMIAIGVTEAFVGK
jgi:tetratricopeptide (TPR) repeat protein